MQDYLESEQDQFIEQSQTFFPAAMVLKFQPPGDQKWQFFKAGLMTLLLEAILLIVTLEFLVMSV